MSQTDISQFKKVAYSGRAFIDVAYTYNSGISLHLMPYFQTALTNYNVRLEDELAPKGQVYRPYSIGVTIGIGF